MTQPLFYFAGLALVLAYPLGIEPLHFARHPSWGGVPVVLPATGGAWILYGIAVWGLWSRRSSPSVPARWGLKVLALLLFAVLVHVFHLPMAVGSLGLEGNLFLEGLVSLLPLAGMYALLGGIEAWKGVGRGKEGSFAGILTFSFRRFLGLSLFPLGFVLGMADLFLRIPVFREMSFIHPLAGWMPVVGGMALLLLVLPWGLRLALGARSLPPGPLSDRLAALAAVAGFRRVRFLVWDTGGLPLSNAFVAGLQPLGKTVFFTEPILSGMPWDLLEAVLAHELAHLRKGHMRHYVLMGAGFVAAGALIEEALVCVSPLAALGGLLVLAGLFWLGIFGYVSRRFETEADLEAAKWCGTSGGPPFGGARRVALMLVTLARLNRVPLRAWFWRHFSLGKRIRILLAAGRDPSQGRVWERRCGRLRTAGAVFFLIALGALGLVQTGRCEENRRKWEAYGRVERGLEFARQGRFEEAVRELKAGIEAGAGEARIWLWVADCERQLGREEAAREALERARRGFLADPRDRLRVELEFP